MTEWIAKHNKRNVSLGTFAETTSFGELDVLATLWAGTSNAIKMATKTSDPPSSQYRTMQSSISEYFKQWAQNLTHPSEVAEVILQDVTSDNPDSDMYYEKTPSWP